MLGLKLVVGSSVGLVEGLKDGALLKLGASEGAELFDGCVLGEAEGSRLG